MSTISVPLTPELEKFIEATTKEHGLAKSDVVRQALTFYAQEQAVRKVLLSSAEPTLEGNLDDLANEIS